MRWLPGLPSTDGEPLPGTVPWWGTLSLQVGSYLQHAGSAPGVGPRHLPQHPLTLQGDGVYGGQERVTISVELQGKESEGP